MLNLGHKKLDVWKKAMALTSKVYQMTAGFPKSELYGLSSQVRRAAVSVASNIAEGASRSSAQERRRFYEIARSSLVELDTQLEIASSLDYFSSEEVSGLSEDINHLFAMLTSMIKGTK